MQTILNNFQLAQESDQYPEQIYNRALVALSILRKGVLSQTTTTPPTTPLSEDAYVVPTGATGIWSTQIGNVAHFYNGSWYYYSPVNAVHVFVLDEAKSYYYTGSTWAAVSGGGGGGSTTVVDALTSTSTTSALSANQGNVLKGLVDTNTTSITTNTTAIASNTTNITGNTSNITTNTTNITTNTTDITALKTTANTAFVGTINATTGLLSFVTVKGSALGFVNGSALPSSTTALGNAFVVVTSAGTFIPSGGSSTAFNVGDILAANGTTYQKLATGSSSGSAPSGLVTLTDGATITVDTSLIDASGNGNFKVTIAGNRTLAFTNLSTIRRGIIEVIQDTTGGRTLTQPSGSQTPSGGGILLTGTANAKDFVNYYYDGTTLHLASGYKNFS